MKAPPPLNPGDRISVVAPSGPFDDELLRAGLSRLNDYEVIVPDALWGRRTGFLAGDDSVRLMELQHALDATDTRAVWMARGGYGLGRIIPLLDFSGLTRNPKWLVGFSDATLLHCALSQRGIASLHAPNGTTLASAEAEDVDSLLQILSGNLCGRITALESWAPGRARGPLWGGNLTVLFAEAAAGRLEIPAGAVLLLEDVTETSYRIDRMLSALSAGGYFAKIAAVVLGEFVDCSPGKFDVPASKVLAEHLIRLGVPVLAGLPVGHAKRNRPLVIGGETLVDAASGTLSVDGPASA